MTERMIEIADGFWSIRGEMKVAGLVDFGTHCSLAALSDDRFVMLDSYTLPPDIHAEVDRLTKGGEKLAAIVNLHPFHTLHCEWMHEAYPHADLYGTARHHEKLPHLPWVEDTCEEGAINERFGEDFAFSVPQGVPLVCEGRHIHFSSILAYHKGSRTIHVDDTLSFLDAGFPLSLLPIAGRFDFHPSLARALEKRAGAADEFREWAIELGIAWSEARHLVTAHDAVLTLDPPEFADRIGAALGRVKPLLDRHRRQYG
ncbi:hypothetical protein GRI38_06375 [Altererythrobacter aurantiacus]|uniref:Metallo-beta-lactamase domain-containing protein n=1 Tax=Parapontixanthobacter aurantiacus TaxID=1463599 RepID=A0A844ZDP5_9SPHN|nr:hypothetical protein [Parapontixanthobacter aurantiacus]MXO85654.1 hypothetical protein [Parapontixanthobacter aurantiacus]